MNLADAIRKAAQDSYGSSVTRAPLKVSSAESASAAVVYRLPSKPVAEPIVSEIAEEDVEDSGADSILNDEELTPQGFIRIEVHVPPEQLNRVLRSVVATQHTILTLREAANYLRVTSTRLEELAKSGEIPGFLVDGKWRFSRVRLENLPLPNSLDKEENS